MKLIADSGGTKTAWFLVHEGQAYQGPESSGINLNVISPATAKAGIAQTILPALKERPVEELHFYGAGLGTSSHVDTMRELLTSLFPAPAPRRPSCVAKFRAGVRVGSRN